MALTKRFVVLSQRDVRRVLVRKRLLPYISFRLVPMLASSGSLWSALLFESDDPVMAGGRSGDLL